MGLPLHIPPSLETPSDLLSSVVSCNSPASPAYSLLLDVADSDDDDLTNSAALPGQQSHYYGQLPESRITAHLGSGGGSGGGRRSRRGRGSSNKTARQLHQARQRLLQAAAAQVPPRDWCDGNVAVQARQRPASHTGPGEEAGGGGGAGGSPHRCRVPSNSPPPTLAREDAFRDDSTAKTSRQRKHTHQQHRQQHRQTYWELLANPGSAEEGVDETWHLPSALEEAVRRSLADQDEQNSHEDRVVDEHLYSMGILYDHEHACGPDFGLDNIVHNDNDNNNNNNNNNSEEETPVYSIRVRVGRRQRRRLRQRRQERLQQQEQQEQQERNDSGSAGLATTSVPTAAPTLALDLSLSSLRDDAALAPYLLLRSTHAHAWPHAAAGVSTRTASGSESRQPQQPSCAGAAQSARGVESDTPDKSASSFLGSTSSVLGTAGHHASAPPPPPPPPPRLVQIIYEIGNDSDGGVETDEDTEYDDDDDDDDDDASWLHMQDPDHEDYDVNDMHDDHDNYEEEEEASVDVEVIDIDDDDNDDDMDSGMMAASMDVSMDCLSVSTSGLMATATPTGNPDAWLVLKSARHPGSQQVRPVGW